MAPSPGWAWFGCFARASDSLDDQRSSTSKANGVAEERNSGHPLARLHSSGSSSPLSPDAHDSVSHHGQRHGWTDTTPGTPSGRHAMGSGGPAAGAASRRAHPAGNKVVPISERGQPGGAASISLRASAGPAARDSPPIAVSVRPERLPLGARPLPPDMTTPDSAGAFNSGDFLTGR